MSKRQSYRLPRLLIEAMEKRTLLSVGTLTGATYSFGAAPGPDCADPVRDVAYVVNSGTNQILAINTDSGTVVGVCNAAANVAGLAVSVDDTRLFASEPGAFQIEVFSLPAMTLLKTLNVGVAVGQIFGIANDRIAGTTSNVTIFNAETGATLYSFANAYDGLVRTNTAGTDVYTRDVGLSGDSGSVNVWDVSGTGAPVNDPQVPGPTGANEEDYSVDPVGGKAYLEDGGVDGIEVTLISNGAQTTWGFVGGGGPGIAVAALEGGAYVYGMTAFGTICQFNQGGVELAYMNLPNYGNSDTLVITPNGNLLYTYGTGIGIVNLGTLNGSVTPHLAFTTQPAASLSGSAISPAVVVDVENPGGSIATSDNSSVTLSLASGTGAISGTTTVAAVNGVATFSNIKITGSGTYTLGASDGGDTVAASNSFAVSVPHLAFVEQPGSVLSGATISPAVTVEILDENNHVVTSDNSDVTLAVASGSGSLGGTVTVAAASGVATFNNVSVSGTGSFTLGASDGGDSAATSNTFAVSVPHLAFAQQPTTVVAGATISPAVTVELLNPSNQVVTSDDSTVTLSLASGSGGLNGTLTAAAVNGIATFGNLSVTGAGAHTLQAADGSYAIATSNTFTVLVPHLAFVQQPGNSIANMAISPAVTVEVLSPSNQLETSDNSDTVTLSLASGSGSLDGTVSAAVSNGIATFSNLAVANGGTYTLLASDGIDTTATSSSFNVIVRHLAFVQQPSDAIAGNTISPSVSVEIEDQNNNLVTTGGAGITLAVYSGPSQTMDGTLTVATVNGVATFGGLSLDTAGAYTLSAGDGGDAPATSSAFTIAPASAAKVAFAQQPGPTLVGNSITPAVTVDVEDPFGNVVTSDTSQVNLSLASGTAGAALNGTVSVAAQNGVATFAGLSLSQAGMYGLAAADGSLAPATSNTFAVTLAPPSPLTPSFGNVTLAGAVVAGARLKGKVPIVIDNTGNVFKGNVTINLYANSSDTLNGDQVLLTSVPKRLSLKPDKHSGLNASLTSLPVTLPDGSYYILAQVVDPTGATSVTATSRTLTVAAPFIQPSVTATDVTPSSISEGKAGLIDVIITNNGNIPARGVSVSLQPSVDGVSSVAGLVLKSAETGAAILPGKSKKIALHFKVTSALAAGDYYPYLSISLGGVSTTYVGASKFTIG